MRRLARMLVVVALAAAAALAVAAVPVQAQTVPAQAVPSEPAPAIATARDVDAAMLAVSTYACKPSATGWETQAAWGNGTVVEGRGCLQYGSPNVRARTELRMRRGGTALQGNWDLTSFMSRVHDYTTALNVGTKDDYVDVIGASYIVKYSNWGCMPGSGSHLHIGEGFNWRATPPGGSRSGYHSTFSHQPNNGFILCP
jgi:hypothetical protein